MLKIFSVVTNLVNFGITLVYYSFRFAFQSVVWYLQPPLGVDSLGKGANE